MNSPIKKKLVKELDQEISQSHSMSYLSNKNEQANFSSAKRTLFDIDDF